MKWLGTKNLGMLFLGIWLTLTGLLPFFHVTFANMGVVMELLAATAGIFLLLGR